MSHIGTTFYFNPPTDYNQCLLSVKTLKNVKSSFFTFFFAWLLFKKYCKRKETVLKNTVREISPSWCHAGGALIPSATLVATPTTKRWLHPLRLPLFSSPFNFVESPKGCQFYQQAANRGLKCCVSCLESCNSDLNVGTSWTSWGSLSIKAIWGLYKSFIGIETQRLSLGCRLESIVFI